jgi:Ca2+:H+ antiporter
LLALSIASVIIPTAFGQFTNTTDVPIARLSRGTAVVLLLVYSCYLYFQLKTHSAMYAQEGEKATMQPSKDTIPPGSVVKGLAAASAIAAARGITHPINNNRELRDEFFQRNAYELKVAADGKEPQLHIWVAVSTLVASTIVVALCTEFMVGSISAITSRNSAISIEFMGLILLPIVGNAVEHATAVTVACNDKMDLAIGVAI